ncbi:MAG: HdeA/HdeB family chaperone [Roseiarcus sp.]|jgi:hypothetical protein
MQVIDLPPARSKARDLSSSNDKSVTAKGKPPHSKFATLNVALRNRQARRVVRRTGARRANASRGANGMRRYLIAAVAAALVSSSAFAQVELKTYEDANGGIDVQKLTCAQLAGTFQEDADFLAVWYSGWYNGLAQKHVIYVDRAKDAEHRLIVFCKANPDKTVIKAIDIVFTQMRKEMGIKLK